MNLVINNYGHFRLTDHGRGQFQLYDRSTGVVVPLTEAAYGEIKSCENTADATQCCADALNEALERQANESDYFADGTSTSLNNRV